MALSLSAQVTGRVSPMTHNRHCTLCGQELHWQISIPEPELSQLPTHRAFPLSPNTLPLVFGRVTSTVVPLSRRCHAPAHALPKTQQVSLSSCNKSNCSPCTRNIQLLQQPALYKLMERGNGSASLYWLQKSCL